MDNPRTWIPEVRKINDAIVRAEENRRNAGVEVMTALRSLFRTQLGTDHCPVFQRPDTDPCWDGYAKIVNREIVVFRETVGRIEGCSLAKSVHQRLLEAGLFDRMPNMR